MPLSVPSVINNSIHMKALKFILNTALLLIQAAIATAFAQDKPKAGDIISGIVCDPY